MMLGGGNSQRELSGAAQHLQQHGSSGGYRYNAANQLGFENPASPCRRHVERGAIRALGQRDTNSLRPFRHMSIGVM